MRFFAIFLLIIVLCGVVGFVPTLRQQVLNISFYIKSFYDSKKENVSLFIDNYTNQAQRIKEMREQIKTLEQQNIKYESLQAEYDSLHYATDIERHYIDPDVHLVKVLSYATLGVYTKIWIDYNETRNERKIFGLIKDGYAIGIAKWVGNSLQGILNGDMECSYSVYIGDNRVPGILRTTQGGIVVDYIPAWQSVKSGDLVRTSGLDGIFFEGVQVGILGNVKYENGYLKAEITPYNFSNRLSYVWLVDTKIEQAVTLHESLIEQEQGN
ncbi:rod shape-determining protein MreC [Helicobacter saguini]|uniref:rod shape-determining protein MreC n=1 Tax=Helicobacter saguini TaxID=1548018 RepID=UPI000B06B8F5|nr:rod shape-determining protein MreC [Helicobacter saguini]